MTKKLKTMIPMLFAGVMMLAAAPAEARRGGHWGGMDGKQGKRLQNKGKRFKMLKAKLGLSDAQLQQIKAIRADARTKTKAQRQQIRPLRKQMRTLMRAETFDASQIYALHSQIRSLRQLIGEERFKAKLQVMQVMTAEQRAKLQQLRKQKRQKRFKRFKQGGANS